MVAIIDYLIVDTAMVGSEFTTSGLSFLYCLSYITFQARRLDIL